MLVTWAELLEATELLTMWDVELLTAWEDALLETCALEEETLVLEADELTLMLEAEEEVLVLEAEDEALVLPVAWLVVLDMEIDEELETAFFL